MAKLHAAYLIKTALAERLPNRQLTTFVQISTRVEIQPEQEIRDRRGLIIELGGTVLLTFRTHHIS